MRKIVCVAFVILSYVSMVHAGVFERPNVKHEKHYRSVRHRISKKNIVPHFEVTDIAPGHFMAGKVVPPQPSLAVVLYLKTDRWYMHPAPDEYAAIRLDGKWVINLVKRRDNATHIAILLVDKYGSPPNPNVINVYAVPHVLVLVIDLATYKDGKYKGKF